MLGKGYLRPLVFAMLLCAVLPAGAQEPVAFKASELTIESVGRSHHFNVELAETPEQKSRGLMFRREMAADAGMLFIYPRETVVTMWMRNTFIPLDMLFIEADGRIAHIAERAVPRSDGTISSRTRVLAVLEINGGAARRLGIAVGDRVVHPAFASR
jgi:hypothetical protein